MNSLRHQSALFQSKISLKYARQGSIEIANVGDEKVDIPDFRIDNIEGEAKAENVLQKLKSLAIKKIDTEEKEKTEEQNDFNDESEMRETQKTEKS